MLLRIAGGAGVSDSKAVSEVYAFGGTPLNSRTAPVMEDGEPDGLLPAGHFAEDVAHIHPEAADPGTGVTLGWDVMGEEHAVSGTVVELPFLTMSRAAG